MEEKQIEDFLKNNDVSLQIIGYISNTHLLKKLIAGKNITGVSTKKILEKFPELNHIEYLNTHLRVLVKMGLLKHAGHPRNTKKSKKKIDLKKSTKHIWTVPPGIAKIIKKITDNT